MDTQKILSVAADDLGKLVGNEFDILTISKPASLEAAVNLTKMLSKLSPLVGNLIEFASTELLNARKSYAKFGRWIRQDPGFPDTIFKGNVLPVPGIEIKTWLPLATEITARFRGSQSCFFGGQTNVCLLAWLPDKIIYGRPVVFDVCIVPGLSLAQARDNHYHNPPDYLVLEPEDTTERSKNLKQINTAGYKWQGTPEQLKRATDIVNGWGAEGKIYQPVPDYSLRLRKLTSKFPYRLDTNYAKIDRIVHMEIEKFKNRVLYTTFERATVGEWSRLLTSGNKAEIEEMLKLHLS